MSMNPQALALTPTWCHKQMNSSSPVSMKHCLNSHYLPAVQRIRAYPCIFPSHDRRLLSTRAPETCSSVQWADEGLSSTCARLPENVWVSKRHHIAITCVNLTNSFWSTRLRLGGKLLCPMRNCQPTECLRLREFWSRPRTWSRLQNIRESVQERRRLCRWEAHCTIPFELDFQFVWPAAYSRFTLNITRWWCNVFRLIFLFNQNIKSFNMTQISCTLRVIYEKTFGHPLKSFLCASAN